MTVNVASNKTTNALVDVEIYNGSTKSFQWFSDGQSFAPNVSRQFTATWTVPANEATTVHVVKVGVFGPGWNGVAHWNDDAARITVAASGVSTTVAPSTPTTTTTMKPTTTTQATTTTTTTMPPSTTSAPTATNGWTTSVTVDRTQVERGGAVTVTVNVASNKTTNALVDVEIYNGSTKSFQRFWDGQPFTANVSRQLTATWTVPASEATTVHVVKVGVFGPGWNGMAFWSDDVARITVAASGGSTTTQPPATTTTVKPTTTTQPTTTQPTTTTTTVKPTTTTAAPTTTRPPTTGHFSTLPPGSALPSDATCAAQVRPMAERRAINNTPNHTRGAAVAGLARVTGDFTGTTDEIIEWVACKWGIDEDIVRAQIAQESWWHQDAKGDLTSDQNACYPTFRTGSGQCPESIGLGQVRYQYHTLAFTNGYAAVSSAFNLDYTYSVWRGCYEGQLTWLNTVERGARTPPGTSGAASAPGSPAVGTRRPHRHTSQRSRTT